MASMENDPLAAYLDALARDVCYRVDEVLKTAPHETTEVVYFVGANAAELGPFVRKRIAVDAAMGDAYGHLFQAQRDGRRFRHLPRIYDVHTTGNELVVVMEYIQGRTLRDEVYERDGSVALAAQWFPLLCDGVMELHEQFSPPLIHRDLKPTNIVVSDAGLTIIDFGIARAFREGAAGDTAHFGTRCYAPPEQFGFGQTDVRSDVYALGMLLFYCLTQRTATAQDRAAAFACSGVPSELQAVIAHACSFDPDGRFASVRELQAAFAKAAARIQGRKAPSEGTTAGSSSKGKETAGKGFFSKVRNLPMHIPQGVGIAWNVVVALFWLLVVVASVKSCFWPSSDMAEVNYPMWLRVVEYFVFMIPSITCICYEVSDRRRVRRRFPVLAKLPLFLEFIVVALVVPFGLAVVMTLCYNIIAV